MLTMESFCIVMALGDSCCGHFLFESELWLGHMQKPFRTCMSLPWCFLRTFNPRANIHNSGFHSTCIIRSSIPTVQYGQVTLCFCKGPFGPLVVPQLDIEEQWLTASNMPHLFQVLLSTWRSADFVSTFSI